MTHCSPRGWLRLLIVLASLAAAAAAAAPRAEAQGPPPDEVPAARPADAVLEERLRKLEARYDAMERRHADEYNALARKYEALKQRVDKPADRPEASKGASGPEGSRAAAGVGSEGAGGRSGIVEVDARPARRPAKVDFSEGLVIKSDDDEFKLTFHNLTQAEYRGFPQSNQNPVHSQFFVPRQRWYFTGQVTKNVQFYTDINRGYGNIDLLDAFITLNLGGYARSPEAAGTGAEGTGGRTNPRKPSEPDSRLRFRIGRFKTPYLYEYFDIAEGDLVAPERSLYASNFALNREVGAIFLGDVLDNRVSYAAGVFNGPRRSFEDANDAKDLFAYLNARPFLEADGLEALKYLNLGGSFNEGFETGTIQPGALRTANDQTPNPSAAALSPTFFQFNNNVVEQGQRDQWSGHLAYYYKSLGILAEYGGGFAHYGLRNNPTTSTRVAFDGYTLQAFYFLTGERLTRRVNVVRPRDDFGFHDGHFGLGAIEVFARYSTLELGRNVFTAGLADPNNWTDRAYAIDTGLNWYLNYYTKIYLDWQHAVFGDPVLYAPGRFQKTSDLLWLRFQVYF